MRAWHWYHFENCAECGRLLQSKEPILETIQVNFDGTVIDVKCSLPASRFYNMQLREQLNSRRSPEKATVEFDFPAAPNSFSTLPYWIFHPSHRDDPRKCLFNYQHVMREGGQVASYVQIAVVRSEKFQAYRSTWGRVLAIFQLPSELPSCDLGPNEGGVGYARLFIQKMAFALKLEYIYVIDDNVALMSEVEFGSGALATSDETVLRNENGVMKMQRCSFSRPLTHLQKIAEGKDEPPPDCGTQYEPHPFKDQFEAQQFPLYSYTGPAKLFGEKQHESYGVLGLLRSVPRVARPFAKTQVYAAVLLNVKSTVEKKVFYRPWPCWEDLRFNDDCDRAGLWVVKCNRYLFHKVQYKDWINNLALPSIFEWKSDSTLKERPQSSQLPKDLEESIILEHLRDIVSKGPDKCYIGQIGYDRPEDSNDQLSPTRIVEKLEAREGTEDEFANEIPILIVSYCASIANRKAKDMVLLVSRFCAAKEKIVFVTSARDAIERWPQITSKSVSTHNGICLSSEMSDRNASFSIFSAADPERHHVRWILIEASFLPNDEANEEKNKLTVEANVSENVIDFASTEPNVDESTIPYPTTSSTSIGNEGNSSTNSFQEYLCTTPSPQKSSNVERSDQESSSANQSLRETPGVKKYLQKSLSVKKSLQESPSAKKSLQECLNAKKSLLKSPSVKRSIEELPSVIRSFQESSRSLQDSPSKRMKIDDYSKHLEGRISGDDVDNGTANGKRTSENDLNYVSLEGSGEISHHQISMEKKVKRKKTSFSEKGTRKNKKSGKGDFEIQSNTPDNEQSKMSTKKKKKGRTKNSCSSTSSINSVPGEEVVSSNVKNLPSASSYQDEEDEIFVVDDNSDKACSQTSTTSNYSIDDWEMERTNVPQTYSALTYPNKDGNTENGGDSEPSTLSSSQESWLSQRLQETPQSGKISPSNPAYMTGTNNVTKSIVDLWREYRKMRRNNEGDLTMERVGENFNNFANDDLQMADKQGYTALLKACSLPSTSPHLVQYLIVARKVDLNCTLPRQFVINHSAADGLVPGMSPLSVAIRRGNVNCISTFMRRQTEIDIRSADERGNTALHHSVLLISKSAFQKLFPLYKPLKWKEMRNSESNSPMDIAWNLTKENANVRSRTKKQTLRYILQQMEEMDLSYVLR